MRVVVSLAVLAWFVGISSHCLGQSVKDSARDIANQALSILRPLSEQWTSKPILYSKIAVILARAGDRETALEVFQEAIEHLDADELVKSSELCEIAINQSRAGLDDHALATQETISTEFFYPEGYFNERCLLGIAESLAHRGNLANARAIAHRIKCGDDRCYIFARLAAISNEKGQKEECRQFVSDAVDCIKHDSPASDEWASTLAPRVVYELVEGRLMDDAAEIVAAVAASADDEYDWNGLVEMQGMCGNVDGVRSAAAELMKFSDSLLDQPFCTLHLAQAQAKAGLFEEACENARVIRDDNDEFYEYGSAVRYIAQEYIKQNRLAEALAINRTISENDHSRPYYYDTLLEIAVAEYNRGNQEEAKELLAEVQRSIAGITSYNGHPSWFNDLEFIAQVFGEIGLREDLEKWAESFESPYAKVSALIGLASGLLNSTKK